MAKSVWQKIFAYCLVIAVLSTGCASLKPEMEIIEETSVDKYYELIVVGAEPEGIVAAVSAARNGVHTLLISEDDELGGLFTLGWLNFLDMNYGPEKELLTRGIFEEFYEDLGNAFDIEEAKAWFNKLVEREPNISLKLGADLIEPLMNGEQIRGLLVTEKGIASEYIAERVIDATADADIAAAAGVPYSIGAEDHGQAESMMGVTLVFGVKGVSWPAVFLYNNLSRLASKIKPEWGDPHAGAGWKVAWGYGQQALEYEAHDPDMRFRGPNMARQKDDTILLNALLIFEANALDPLSKEQAIERGRAELPYIMGFMRENFFGFGKAELSAVAEKLYVRETRHIFGEYRLTIDDVLECRDHWDRIAHGSYPVDIQPVGPDNLGNVIGKPAVYSIPLRCMVPLVVENMLVVGRSASYDSLPHGSARVVPVGMAVGEAAGVTAAYSLQFERSFREISADTKAVEEIQKRLQEQGAYLAEISGHEPEVMDHWAYEGLRVMRSLGLAAGGYSNDYGLENAVRHWDINYLQSRVCQRAKQLRPSFEYTEMVYQENFTQNDFVFGLAGMLNEESVNNDVSLALLREKGILTIELEKHMAETPYTLDFSELYMLLGNTYKAIIGSEFIEKE